MGVEVILGEACGEAEGTGGIGTGVGTSPRRNGLEAEDDGVRRIVARPFVISKIGLLHSSAFQNRWEHVNLCEHECYLCVVVDNRL